MASKTVCHRVVLVVELAGHTFFAKVDGGKEKTFGTGDSKRVVHGSTGWCVVQRVVHDRAQVG